MRRGVKVPVTKPGAFLCTFRPGAGVNTYSCRPGCPRWCIGRCRSVWFDSRWLHPVEGLWHSSLWDRLLPRLGHHCWPGKKTKSGRNTSTLRLMKDSSFSVSHSDQRGSIRAAWDDFIKNGRHVGGNLGKPVGRHLNLTKMYTIFGLKWRSPLQEISPYLL